MNYAPRIAEHCRGALALTNLHLCSILKIKCESYYCWDQPVLRSIIKNSHVRVFLCKETFLMNTNVMNIYTGVGAETSRRHMINKSFQSFAGKERKFVEVYFQLNLWQLRAHWIEKSTRLYLDVWRSFEIICVMNVHVFSNGVMKCVVNTFVHIE